MANASSVHVTEGAFFALRDITNDVRAANYLIRGAPESLLNKLLLTVD
jgi:hypothetical protein